MKRLLISLFLVLVLMVTFAAPICADSEKSNMPGKAADLGPWKGLWNFLRIGQGLGNGNGSPMAWGIGVSVRHAIFNIMNGEPPAHNWNGPEPW